MKPSTNGSNGRDESGRFTTGNPGGPGNPFARQVAALHCELLAAITKRDIRDIAGGLLKMAKKGEVGAARLILGYCIGSPTVAPDPDTLDERELNNLAGYNKAEREAQISKPSTMDRVFWGLNK